jgi:hypothetical protein
MDSEVGKYEVLMLEDKGAEYLRGFVGATRDGGGGPRVGGEGFEKPELDSVTVEGPDTLLKEPHSRVKDVLRSGSCMLRTLSRRWRNSESRARRMERISVIWTCSGEKTSQMRSS